MDLQTYSLVKQRIRSLLNINLDHYKDEQMRRRLDSWLARSSSKDWTEYLHRLKTDTTELSRLRDYLTINVSSFFRDLERWQALRDTILPELIAYNRQRRSLAPLNIWSAGCSIGAEAYSLAMLMDELIPRQQARILATDLDRGALMKARQRGPYTADEIQNLTPAQRSAYLAPGGPPFYLKDSFSGKIEFREHNMLTDPFPEDMDLIVCRNVVIYFTTETKDMLYRKFVAALRPGGILFVGATEIIPRPVEIGLKSHGISFYQKV
jgi:chemotaxis protein methyltransferase CheR